MEQITNGASNFLNSTSPLLQSPLPLNRINNPFCVFDLRLSNTYCFFIIPFTSIYEGVHSSTDSPHLQSLTSTLRRDHLRRYLHPNLAKISLFIWLDPSNAYQSNLPSLTKSYTLTFPRVFSVSPQVALGLYTLDADYSVYFQVYYQDVTVNDMTVWVSKLSSNSLNQIYIMYFGTDLSNFECALLQYSTDPLIQTPSVSPTTTPCPTAETPDLKDLRR